MSDKSNKYGYVGVDIPAQSFGSNKGVFNPAEINELVADNKWTSFGQLELIETKDISGASKSIFSSIQESTYNVHLLIISDVSFTANSQIRVRLYESGVEETASVYQYAYLLMESTGGFSEIKSTANNYMTYSTFNNGQRNQYIYFYNLGDSSKYSFCTTHSSEWDGKNTNIFGSGVLPQTSTVDGISLTSGTTVSGQASLYGIRYS